MDVFIAQVLNIILFATSSKVAVPIHESFETPIDRCQKRIASNIELPPLYQ